MKLIKAIIRGEKLTEVLNALYEAEIYGLTVSRVRGHGGEKEKVEIYRGTKYKHELNDKVTIEIGVSESFVERTVQTINDGCPNRRGRRRENFRTSGRAYLSDTNR